MNIGVLNANNTKFPEKYINNPEVIQKTDLTWLILLPSFKRFKSMYEHAIINIVLDNELEKLSKTE